MVGQGASVGVHELLGKKWWMCAHLKPHAIVPCSKILEEIELARNWEVLWDAKILPSHCQDI